MSGPRQAQGAPLRIIWLVDGPYVATEPTESTMSKVVEQDGKLVHLQYPSVMVSRAIRPATRDEVQEWRIRE